MADQELNNEREGGRGGAERVADFLPTFRADKDRAEKFFRVVKDHVEQLIHVDKDRAETNFRAVRDHAETSFWKM